MAATQREAWQGVDAELAMADYGAAQTWTAEETYTLTEVWLRMANSGTLYTGTLTLDLYSVSGGEPDTKITTLWSNSVNSWGAVMSWRVLTGMSQAITNGTEYAFVVNLNPLRDATHYIRWSGKSGYTGGVGYQEHTDEVYTNAGIDFHFINFGTDAAAPPTKAENPTPTHTDTEVNFEDYTFSWDDGGDADTFDVWAGPSGSLVKISDGQSETSYTATLGQLPVNVVIYWRIDAINDLGTTTGDTWYFDPRPLKVSVITSPTDTAIDIGLNDTSAIWESPSDNTVSYDVYYGLSSGNLTLVDNTVLLTLALLTGAFSSYNTTQYWRVDSVNSFATIAGDEYSFTTLLFYPVLPTGITLDGNGNPTGTPSGLNFIMAIQKLVAAAENTIWFEDL